MTKCMKEKKNENAEKHEEKEKHNPKSEKLRSGGYGSRDNKRIRKSSSVSASNVSEVDQDNTRINFTCTAGNQVACCSTEKWWISKN